MDKIPMTPEGLAQLEVELRRLRSQERPAVIRALAEAREHGDLSENAEYHAARERQSFIEGRIAELEERLRSRPPGETAADALRAWLPEMVAGDAHLADEHRRRRAVIDADEALCAYEHRFMARAQAALTEAFAADLGVGPDALEPRMAASATMTVFEVLGRDLDPAESPLAALDRALVFIGGGIGALRA